MTNLKHLGCCTSNLKGNIIGRFMKETTKLIDAKKKEDECAKEKLKHDYDFVDAEA